MFDEAAIAPGFFEIDLTPQNEQCGLAAAERLADQRRALVTEALRRGAKNVYAGTRSGALENTDSRVTPLTLDVTNTAQIQAAIERVESLDVLINNAGVRCTTT